VTGETRGRAFNITADGSGSVVNLSALTQLRDQNNAAYNFDGFSHLTAQNGGTIQAPALTSVSNTQITLDGTGTLPVSQITDLTGSQLNLSVPRPTRSVR